MFGQHFGLRSGQGPSTTLNTPGGRPASVKICASFSVVSGVYSEGFTTVTHPLASNRSERLAQDHQGMIERRAVGDDADRRPQRVVQI